MRKVMLSIFLAAFPSEIVNAQVSDQTCLALAQAITTGQTVKFTNTQTKALQYYVYCEASKTSDKKSINVLYEALSVGAAMSDDQQKQLCSKSFDSYDFTSTEYSNAKVLFSETLPTVQACFDAAAQQWVVQVKRIQDNAITVDIRNGETNGADILGIDLSPEDSIKCTGAPQKFPFLVTSTVPNIVSMTCVRKPDDMRSQT